MKTELDRRIYEVRLIIGWTTWTLSNHNVSWTCRIL